MVEAVRKILIDRLPARRSRHCHLVEDVVALASEVEPKCLELTLLIQTLRHDEGEDSTVREIAHRADDRHAPLRRLGRSGKRLRGGWSSVDNHSVDLLRVNDDAVDRARTRGNDTRHVFPLEIEVNDIQGLRRGGRGDQNQNEDDRGENKAKGGVHD